MAPKIAYEAIKQKQLTYLTWVEVVDKETRCCRFVKCCSRFRDEEGGTHWRVH